MAAWKGALLISAGGLLGGCELLFPRCPGISVMRQFVDHDFYASSQVRTPDERAPHYPEGERLIVGWHIPKEWLADPLELRVRILYRNHDQEVLTWPIHAFRGSCSVDCIGKEYQERCGFLTYCIEMLQDNQIVLAEPHQLWFSWIDVESSQSG